MPRIWQISGGPATRTYADLFIKYGVGLIGPGDAGAWSPQRPEQDFVDEQGTSGAFVRRFANEMQVSDVVLLRTGIAKIAAVGVVASEYMYLDQFDEVNGWDLQHARRIRWCELPKEHDFDNLVFGANPPRCSQIQNPVVRDYAERFVNSPPMQWQERLLPELPDEEPVLDEVPAVLGSLVAQAQDLARFFWDRERFGDHPSEDELVAHFVVPFLRQLGWPPEMVAVKWRRIDVAVFGSLPRTPENCRFVIEAKRLGAGVEGALEQAKGYVESLGVARDIIVTDGIRYRMYTAQDGFRSYAYANLAKLKRSALRLFKSVQRE